MISADDSTRHLWEQLPGTVNSLRHDLMTAALAWAELVPVFPLRPGRKEPLRGSRGFRDATQNRDRVEAWWTAVPTANIGVPTGIVFDVLDFDVHDGKPGLGTLNELG